MIDRINVYGKPCLIDMEAQIESGDTVTDGFDICIISNISKDFYDIENIGGSVKLENKPVHLVKGLFKVIT